MPCIVMKNMGGYTVHAHQHIDLIIVLRAGLQYLKTCPISTHSPKERKRHGLKNDEKVYVKTGN